MHGIGPHQGHRHLAVRLFFSDYSECLVYERHRDSEAFLEHITNLGETMAAPFETCSGSGEICGTPSPELMKALEGWPVRIYSPYQSIYRRLQKLDKELKEASEQDPQAKRLMSITGVGATTAVAVSCWIGDIKRFPNTKKLVSYFGIAPKVRQSANRETHGHIRKEVNGMVRWLLLQAALVGIRMSRGPRARQYLGVC